MLEYAYSSTTIEDQHVVKMTNFVKAWKTVFTSRSSLDMQRKNKKDVYLVPFLRSHKIHHCGFSLFQFLMKKNEEFKSSNQQRSIVKGIRNINILFISVLHDRQLPIESKFKKCYNWCRILIVPSHSTDVLLPTSNIIVKGDLQKFKECYNWCRILIVASHTTEVMLPTSNIIVKGDLQNFLMLSLSSTEASFESWWSRSGRQRTQAGREKKKRSLCNNSSSSRQENSGSRQRATTTAFF